MSNDEVLDLLVQALGADPEAVHQEKMEAALARQKAKTEERRRRKRREARKRPRERDFLRALEAEAAQKHADGCACEGCEFLKEQGAVRLVEKVLGVA